MANGQFADLSAFTRQAAQPVQNPLEALIQGFSTGQAIAQAPQIAAQQQLSDQLKSVLMQQQLQDLLNPQAALARKVQEELTVKGALNPALGIETAPVGLIGETIATPSAIASTAAQLQAGAPVTSALPGAPTTPISVGGIQTGLNINPIAARAATQQNLNDKIALANARAAQQGIPVEYFDQGDGTLGYREKRIAPGATAPVVRTAVAADTGLPAKQAPKGGSSRALTPNAQNAILLKASSAGVDPDDPKYFNEDTQIRDFTKLTIDAGKAARENKRLDNALKAQGLTGKTKTDLEALNAAEQQLFSLQDEIAEISRTGQTPTFFDNALAAVTAAPPSGFFTSLVQQGAEYLQSDDSKYLEGKKSVINSALTKAISGLAVSKDEARRLGFLPRPGESFDSLLRKVSLVEDYINNQREGLSQGSTVPSAPRSLPTASPSSPLRIGRFTVTPQ